MQPEKTVGLTKELMNWFVNARYSDLPDETVDYAKALLFKTATSMVIGSREPLGKRLLRYASAIGGTPEVGVVGAGFRSNVENAAFVNGTLAHATETEDAYFHPNNEAVASCWIFPAILTLGEKLLSRGDEIIAATVFSFEIASRMLRAAPGIGLKRSINTATWFGVPAAAAGASRLLGLDTERAVNAISIASSQSAGLVGQAGYDAHTLEAGHSCRAGVLSAFLAEAGATGVPDLLEGGPGRIYAPVWNEGEIDFTRLTENLGKAPFEIHGAEFKKYPGCGFIHASVDALSTLMEEESLTCDDVERVETEIHAVASQVCDRPFPESIGEARFSFTYLLAEVLLRGKVDHTSFTGTERLFDDKFREAQGKVVLKVNPDWPLNYKGAHITVFKKNGQIVEKELPAFWGSPKNPLCFEDSVKVLVPFLAPIIREAQCNRIVELFRNLENLVDIRELMDILTFFTNPGFGENSTTLWRAG